MQTRIKGLGDDGMRADLAALVEEAGGRITIREADLAPARYSARDGRARERRLRARRFGGRVDPFFRSSSFTALVSGPRVALSPAASEGQDVDEVAEATEVAGASGATGASVEAVGERSERKAVSDEGIDGTGTGAGTGVGTGAGAGLGPAVEAERVPLADFPRGTQAGLFFHTLFETLPFDSPSEARLERASALLRRYGFDPDEWAGPVADAVGRVLQTPLPAGDGTVALASVPERDRRVELEFTLPVAQPVGSTADGPRARLTLARLADAFARHGGGEADGTPARAGAGVGSEWPRRYAEALRGLRQLPLQGYLRGFVDLVYRHQGRYYLLDWKTNHLGDRPGDYGPARLQAAMEAHHYVLQAHLYGLALHRHLAARLPGYRYETHFGGACYLFLRGVGVSAPVTSTVTATATATATAPSKEPATGVWFYRPLGALMQALERAVDGAVGREVQP